MNESIIISNSTPIILLHKIGQLDLLQKLYGKIYIADAVYKEVIIDGANMAGQDFIKQNKWIEIINIEDINAKKMFITSLHDGEVETIILAMEMNADLCVLDDLLARKHAKNFGLQITGTLGILIEAKNKSYVKEVKPILEKLKEIGMYIDSELYSTILLNANEIS